MKNLSLLPEDIQDTVRDYVWTCGCGQQGLRLSVTRKATVQAHCFTCGRTIFFNAPQLFRFNKPFSIYQEEKAIVKSMAKGGTTRWYPKSRVRVFTPG